MDALAGEGVLRLMAQLRWAAPAALTVASIGYGLIDPPTVVNSSVPLPACSMRAGLLVWR
ncbi:hypothetical protein ACL02O_32150 [Micromonospora sp. MS34]|uniref:hypothetical protein n=1 Tax=Micromonospora sp. MS34 TaxID=3385971 RepID=UPI0039A17279